MSRDPRWVPASDLDRNMIRSILSKAQRDGQLSSGEHIRRSHTAANSTTRGELMRLVEDLETETPAFAPPTPAQGGKWFNLPHLEPRNPGNDGPGNPDARLAQDVAGWSGGNGRDPVAMQGRALVPQGAQTNIAPANWAGAPAVQNGGRRVKPWAVFVGVLVGLVALVGVTAIIDGISGSTTGQQETGSRIVGHENSVDGEVYDFSGSARDGGAEALEMALRDSYFAELSAPLTNVHCNSGPSPEIEESVQCSLEYEGKTYPVTVSTYSNLSGTIRFSTLIPRDAGS